MFGTVSLISTRPLESTIKVDPSTPYAACVASGTILDVMVGAMYSDASLKAVTKIRGSQGESEMRASSSNRRSALGLRRWFRNVALVRTPSVVADRSMKAYPASPVSHCDAELSSFS